jgi:TonB-linked SusC/RagA family outer membrane protein
MNRLRLPKLLLLLLLLCSTTTSFSQEKTISGKVIDKPTNTPLQGVSIRVKNGSQATSTDASGDFTIKVPSSESILTFSHVGFGIYETKAGDGKALSIGLSPLDVNLDDVVVVGYGSAKRSNILGAVSSIKAVELENLPVSNLGAALQGRFAGVNVSGGTARPGASATITIRNPMFYTKDAGGTLSPLFIIDDVIRSEEDFNLLDPTEVEDITILKDAAAAIYGVRSANGAIVVKTKRGKVGKTQVTFNSSYAVNDATQLPSMMNGVEHATYLNASTKARRNFVADGGSGYLADAAYYTDDELAHFANNNTDWFKMGWKPSHLMRQTINVSGGSDRATFFAGGSYIKQDGNLDRINLDKWTFRASADVKLATGLKVGLTVNGDIKNTKQYLLKQGGENPENDMKGLLYTPGFTPAYINGLPVRLSSASNQNTIDAFHFFEVQRLNNYNNSDNNGLNIMGNIEYQVPFLKGLTARVQYSKTLDNTFPKQFGTKYQLYTFNMTGEHNHIFSNELNTSVAPVSVSNGNRVYLKPSKSDRYQLNASLGYANKFGKHEFSAIAIVEQAESFYNDIESITEGPIDGAPDLSRFAFGAQTVYETQSETGNLGYIGRANYAFNNKYLAEFSFRYDASTNFAPENRWGFFYSASAGWVVSEENFFKGAISNTINFLKLRASVGHLGTDQVKPYSYQQRYTPIANGGAVFGGNSPISVGTKPENMPNPNAKWDDYMKYGVGIETRFFNSRLSFVADGFYNHGYNLLTSLSSSVPLLVGSPVTPENYSTLNSFGYELTAGWRDNISRNLSYNIGAFFSWMDNKQIKVDAQKGILGTYEDPTGRSSDMGLQGYNYIGMFRNQAEVDKFLVENPGHTIFGLQPKPGMLYYQDIRGAKDPVTNQYAAPDGKVDENDMDFLTPKSSNHYGFGVNLGLGWKGFKLDMVIAGAFGGQGSVEGAARKLGTATSARPEFWKDAWTPENPDAAYPNPFYSASYDVTSSFWFKSSTSIRMRSADLSYGISPNFAKRIGFNNLRVYVSATNPFNFYNPYSYKDNANGSFDTYPNLRTIAFGINASL